MSRVFTLLGLTPRGGPLPPSISAPEGRQNITRQCVHRDRDTRNPRVPEGGLVSSSHAPFLVSFQELPDGYNTIVIGHSGSFPDRRYPRVAPRMDAIRRLNNTNNS